jgi:hypothetical protein
MAKSEIDIAVWNLEMALENLDSRYAGESWNTEDAMLAVYIEAAIRALERDSISPEPRPGPMSMRMVGGLWLFVGVSMLAWWIWGPVIPMW